MADIKAATVRATVREIVADLGEDFTYSAPSPNGYTGPCVYTTADGGPSCIVGMIFSRLGFDDFLADIHSLEWGDSGGGFGPTPIFGLGILHVAEYVPQSAPDITPKALDLLAKIQLEQDQGEAYGKLTRL